MSDDVSGATNLSEMAGGADATQASHSEASQAAEGGSDNQAQPTEAPQAPEGGWMWDDGVKGDGNRPQYLQERYSSVAEQAKAYSELEKKFGEFRGAPKEGYSLEELGLAGDDPLLGHFQETFKELNLSQKGFERIASEYASFMENGAKQQMEAEFKKLGPGAKQTLAETTNWISNNFTDDVAKVMHGWLQTADDVKAIQTLMSIQPQSSLPTFNESAAAASYETVKEVTNEKSTNWKRYKEDENYRTSVQRRLAMAVNREKRTKSK